MRRLLTWLLAAIATILLLAIAAVASVFIGLNTETGRDFAVKEINHFGAGQITVSDLGGHFPEDIKLGTVSVMDTKGVWLTGSNLELRWRPLDLLRRNLHIPALTAENITASRAPVAAPSNAKSGAPKIPDFHLNLDHFAVQTLDVGAALAGQDVTLNIAGDARLENLTHGSVNLTAHAAGGGAYRLTATIDPKTVNTDLHISEPPDGLLGHFAGSKIHAPLTVDLTLAGPRDGAALHATASLGAAQLAAAGTLDLDPASPKADVVFTVPALAPVAALAGQRLGGNTTLHFIAAEQPDQSTNLSLDGDVALTQAPGQAAQLVGPNGHIALLLSIAHQAVNIQQLNVTGAGVSLAAAGSVAASGFDLNTALTLNNVASLSPGISGRLSESGNINGTGQDFAVNATLTGDIAAPKIPSGPFTIAINATHLPNTPTGTLTGSGALENSPLLLDAAFARNAAGATQVTINNALWRSLKATANVTLAPGDTLPTGTAKFAIGRLADFQAFAPLPLAGSINGDFAHMDASSFALNLTAANLRVAPSLGTINATLHANGPTDALGVTLTASIAKLMDVPARIAAAAALNLGTRSATLSAFTAAWHGLNPVLQGPAGITTRPGIAVHHLNLGLDGGRITLDGSLTPRLNAQAAVQNLPARLASLFAPGLTATGTLSATAALTGSLAAPAGRLTLNADAIHARTGPAAGLPPATLAASATLARQTANIDARLNAGPDIALHASGLVPMTATGPVNLHLTGATDLRLTDPILAAEGTVLRGVVTPDVTITGSAAAPSAAGTVTLAGGSVENIGSGLNLTKMSAALTGTGETITLEKFAATAGPGSITGHGGISMDQPGIPINFTLDATDATPISSDIVTENIDAALTLAGTLRGAMRLGGEVTINGANINIPKSLPASIANLPIINRGEPPPPSPPPPPNVSLDLLVRAADKIFVRGDGLFAELGGRLKITGTAADPDPEGGFTLIRGDFALAGKNLQFTSGTVSFNGDGFVPTLDLEATATSNNVTSTLVVGGTAAQPTITLTSTPPAPSDEILANLLFGTGTQNLTAFQAASLAAALAQLSGLGGGGNPLDTVRSTLGLDQLSLGGSGSGPPSIEAGRYVAPGIYVGATQATNGQGTQATVEINLYKGLKLNTATGTSGSGSGAASSVGLTYQFNY
jgi:translocation and assembly module TamB